MVYRQTKSGYVLRLELGDEIIKIVTNFAKERDIKAASFVGLGAVTEAELGYYHLDKKEYEFKKFNEVMEILSIKGNIAMFEGSQYVHSHIVLSGADFSAVGGHLKSAKVAATCEIFITTYEQPLTREHDEGVGLNLLQL